MRGVGFRTFVCALADELHLCGSVRNRGGLVEIVVWSDAKTADRFLERLLSQHPAMARPDLISVEPASTPMGPGFRILPSTDGSGAGLVPDRSVCDACLAEMADPRARRYRYPFIACAHCGPRYTITGGAPFERARTAMAAFPLCKFCRAEYEDPADRRFYAQTMACAACGPSLWFRMGPDDVEGHETVLAATVAALHDGAIVAMKGVGGYHLLCDAADDAAVKRLRLRKRRPSKPFAVMFPRAGRDGLNRLRLECTPDAEEAESLRADERPIVLIPRRDDSRLSPSVAPGLRQLGAFLPYSPLHDLVASGFDGPLVATSGNISGEPVLTDPADAQTRLACVADAFLHHDRPILRPADDGVVRIMAGRARPLRLGRGNAPLERTLSHPLSEPVLALGGQSKVALTLGFDARAVMSPHIGDLQNPRSLDLLEATAETLQRLHGVRVKTLICDGHGGYASTRWAMARQDMAVIRIPHHHAHASALAGEFPNEPRWLCFTWDGAGFGEDGALWGGEGLLGRPGAWVRASTFRPFSAPVGDSCVHEPWRSAAALAWALGLDWAPRGLDVALTKETWRAGLYPPTSAVGRLFDAAAAFLGVEQASYEDEGPMAVEALASTDRSAAGSIPLPLEQGRGGLWQADWGPLAPMLLDATRPRSQRAAVFQASLVRSLTDQAIAIRADQGAFCVGLTGGVFQNRSLSEMALAALQAAGFRAYLPIKLPCNDAGLSFGQVVEAGARQLRAA